MLLKAVKIIQNRTHPIKMILLSSHEIITWLQDTSYMSTLLTCADDTYLGLC